MENGKEPAFAMLDINGGYFQCGLTKREYFAAVAMQGICSNPDAWIGQSFAISAVKIADALLEELNKAGDNE